MRKAINIGLCLLVLCNFLSAAETELQRKPKNEYGFFGFSNGSFASSDVYGAKGYETCCTGFNSGFGLGLNIGAIYKRHFSKVTLFGKLGFASNNYAFFESEFKPVSILVNGEEKFVDAELEHSLKINEQNLLINPGVSFYISSILELNVSYLMSLNLSAPFEQSERLISPAQGTFENKSRIRNFYEGDFEMNKVNHFINFGLSKSIPFNYQSTVILTPEVIFSLGLNNQISFGNFKSYMLSIGFSLTYRTFSDFDSPIKPSN